MKIDPRVAAFLAEIELVQYATAFRSNHITFEMLLALTDAELAAIGVVSLGHRKRILALAGLRMQQSRTPDYPAKAVPTPGVNDPQAAVPSASLALVADTPNSTDSMHDGTEPSEEVGATSGSSEAPYTHPAASHPPPLTGTTSQGTSGARVPQLAYQAEASPFGARAAATALSGATNSPQSSSIISSKRRRAKFITLIVFLAVFTIGIFAAVTLSDSTLKRSPPASDIVTPSLTECEKAVEACRAVAKMSVQGGQRSSSLLVADARCQEIRRAAAGYADQERQMAEQHRLGNNRMDEVYETGKRSFAFVCSSYRAKLP